MKSSALERLDSVSSEPRTSRLTSRPLSYRSSWFIAYAPLPWAPAPGSSRMLLRSGLRLVDRLCSSSPGCAVATSAEPFSVVSSHETPFPQPLPCAAALQPRASLGFIRTTPTKRALPECWDQVLCAILGGRGNNFTNRLARDRLPFAVNAPSASRASSGRPP